MNVEYQLRESYQGSFAGTISLDGATVDIAAMLAAGDGTLVVDGNNASLLAILDAYPALIRVGETDTAAPPIYSTAPLLVRRPTRQPINVEGAPVGAALSVDPTGNLALLPIVGQDDLDSKADLVGGVIPSAQLPQVAITEAHVVPDRAAMLALDVQQGDVAVVTEDEDGLTRTYILTGQDADPTDIDTWVPLPSPGDVNSVNGHLGVVVLTAADVGAVTRTSAALIVYGTNASGVPTVYTINATSASAYSVVQRDADGRAKVEDGSATKDAVNRGQLDGKLSRATGNSRVYVNGSDGNPAVTAFSASADAGTFVIRNGTGQVSVTDGTSAAHAVNRGQLDTALASINGSQLVNATVTGGKIANGTINASNVANDQLTAAKFTPGVRDQLLTTASRTAINALPSTGATVDQVVAALKA